MTRRTAPPPPRSSATYRSRRSATTVPDLLFACAATALTMAAVLAIASFLDEDVTAGDAGSDLARLFAAALAVAGLFGGLLAVLLLRDDRNQADHYLFPCLLGIVAGGIEAIFFLVPVRSFLVAPLALLIFSLRPLRKGVRSLFGRRGGR